MSYRNISGCIAIIDTFKSIELLLEKYQKIEVHAFIRVKMCGMTISRDFINLISTEIFSKIANNNLRYYCHLKMELFLKLCISSRIRAMQNYYNPFQSTVLLSHTSITTVILMKQCLSIAYK